MASPGVFPGQMLIDRGGRFFVMEVKQSRCLVQRENGSAEELPLEDLRKIAELCHDKKWTSIMDVSEFFADNRLARPGDPFRDYDTAKIAHFGFGDSEQRQRIRSLAGERTRILELKKRVPKKICTTDYLFATFEDAPPFEPIAVELAIRRRERNQFIFLAPVAILSFLGILGAYILTYYAFGYAFGFGEMMPLLSYLIVSAGCTLPLLLSWDKGRNALAMTGGVLTAPASVPLIILMRYSNKRHEVIVSATKEFSSKWDDFLKGESERYLCWRFQRFFQISAYRKSLEDYLFRRLSVAWDFDVLNFRSAFDKSYPTDILIDSSLLTNWQKVLITQIEERMGSYWFRLNSKPFPADIDPEHWTNVVDDAADLARFEASRLSFAEAGHPLVPEMIRSGKA